MELTSKIKCYLSVCDDAPAFTIGEKSFPAGSRQEIDTLDLKVVDDDILSITIPGHTKMRVGKASKITALSVRYCGDKGSIIAQYSDPMMNVMGCCICCGSWCVYGDCCCSC